MTNLAATAVTASYGPRVVLRECSFAIGSGEVVAVVGPNGAGKSTLLRVLAGLLRPTAGAVSLDGQDLTTMSRSALARRIAVVPQIFDTLFPFTVREVVALGRTARLGAFGRASADDVAAVDRAIEELDLGPLAARRIDRLSGGERQRAVLAMALAQDPRVLLLDEPFGALDAKVRRDLRRWLLELHNKTGHTTVFVTHDQEEALELADRVVVMSEGRIEQIGTPDEIYDRPNSPFVYSFIGESSTLPVRVEKGKAWIDGHSLDLAVDDVVSGPAQLFFRPHDVEVGDDLAGAIPATVQGVRRHGGTRRLDLTVVGRDDRVEIELPADFGLEISGPIAVRPRRYRVFPAPAPALTS